MTMGFSLSDCESALQANLLGADVHVRDVSIDTRTLSAGDLYIAIQGQNFNGHDFVAAAEEAGAAAILVHEKVDTNLPQLVVEDTTVALGRLSTWWASRFGIPIIAVTGSNGKTSVKEIIAAILRQLGPVLSTKGNLNNEIGVPLTLLGMRSDHLYAVVEMGANHAGEIARLVQIAKPDIAVVNNVGSAHLEGFGSKEGIARAKSEIYSGLSQDGYAVINADDDFAEFMRDAASHCNKREFGLSSGCDVQGIPGAGLNIETLGTKLSPRFQLSGDHNGMNALAAIAAVQCVDVQSANIVRGLESVRSIPGRLEKKPGVGSATLIDDSYNANPDSAKEAINVLVRYDGIRYLVLGDMGELGDEAEALHAHVGAYAKQCGIDGLWTTGPLASHAYKAFKGARGPTVAKPAAASTTITPMISLAGGADATAPASAKDGVDSKSEVSLGGHFVDQEALVANLKQYLDVGVTVLVKGSRGSRMERVVKALMPAPKSRRTAVQEHNS
ncbi:UDP-N-acetylmuramoyl-tripeptide--D-alanyl-D-alanine ligase [Granulosicoccus sp.]|nr:UDP-N-acetylmuramoyl-tripeptide--D-alanyl-D-alanine ligase [Granulosicoccus sp.]MDB4222814.1 UDP-N-acetylmuramoyl-tripeptide--D-alanyl-D-alanine ligase [Granulosicoccus sp.]